MGVVRSFRIGILCTLVLLGNANLGWAAEPNVALARAKELYAQLNDEACLSQLGLARVQPSNAAEATEIEIYSGLCLFRLGQETSAIERFDAALALDASATLPPFTSPKVRERFEDRRLQAPKPSPTAPLLPAPAVTAPRSRIHPVAPWLAGVSVAVLATGVGFGLSAKAAGAGYNASVFQSDARRFAHQAAWTSTTANVAYATAAGCAITAAILQLIHARQRVP